MAEELDIPMPRMAPAEPGYRVSRPREAVDPGTLRLGLIGGGIFAVLLVIGGAWKLSGHRATEVPVVQADSRPLRTKPDNAGGMQVEGQNDAILSGATDGADTLAPPPEVPAPQALKDEAAKLLAARQAAVPPPAAAPLPPAVQPVSVAAAAAPAVPAPVAAPVPAPVAAAMSERPASPPAVAKHEDAATAANTPSALGGHAAVQLAALGTEQSAMLEWRRLTHKMPDLLGGREPSVQRTEAHGKTYYRLRTGGFADIAQATAFCQEVRAKGAGCDLARF